MRLADRRRVLPVAPPRQRERAGARPADRPVGCDVQGLPPPGQPVVGAQLREAPGVVHAFAAGELRRGPGERVPDRRDETHRAADHRHDADGDERRANRLPALGDEAPDREAPRADGDDEGPGDGQRCEDPPVRDAVRAQRAVLDERRPRERPARDGESRDARHTGSECVVQPLVGEHEPQREHDDRSDHPRPRLGQEQREDGAVDEQEPGDPDTGPAIPGHPETERDAGVGEERQGVPVADGLAQPGDPVAVREERGDGDAEQRPAERGRDHERREGGDPPCTAAERSGEEPEREEGEVDEPAREPFPRQVARDRPRHREPRPRRQRGQGGDRRGARTIQPRQGEHAAQRRRERHRCADDRCDADRVERPAAGAAACQDSSCQERARRHQETGLRDASGRERGSRGRVHDAREATMSRSAAAGAPRVAPNGVLHIVYPSLIADPRRTGRLHPASSVQNSCPTSSPADSSSSRRSLRSPR